MVRPTRELAEEILSHGSVVVRDVDAGEEPFVYSTGNRGPGYVQIKGLVGRPQLVQDLAEALAAKVAERCKIDFVNGNATGGMIPGWELRRALSARLGHSLPFTYLRGARKPGGHGELITGLRANPEILKGSRALIVEELVNYAGTTTNSVLEFRAAGFVAEHAACFVTYDQPEARQRLEENGIELIPLLTLPELLEIGSEIGTLSPRAVGSYQDFLANPVRWQLDRGYAVPETALEAAEEQGIELNRLSPDEALEAGAPQKQVQAGVAYYAGA
jgi:orotate phosphoribosyltransferase